MPHAVPTGEIDLFVPVIDPSAPPVEDGAPTCAEDAAEAILVRHRDRHRSTYARTVNTALEALTISPRRGVNAVAWGGILAVVAEASWLAAHR